MRLSPDIPAMLGPHFSTPRKLGAFVICVNPTNFVTKEIFLSAMHRYIDLIRNSDAVPNGEVLARGDREWKVFEQRKIKGIPLDPQTESEFIKLSEKYAIDLPWTIKPNYIG